jgi:hypothetical protein
MEVAGKVLKASMEVAGRVLKASMKDAGRALKASVEVASRALDPSWRSQMGPPSSPVQVQVSTANSKILALCSLQGPPATVNSKPCVLGRVLLQQ